MEIIVVCRFLGFIKVRFWKTYLQFKKNKVPGIKVTSLQMKAKSMRDLKTNRKPGMMSFVCNPSSREGWRKMTDCKVEVKLVYTVSSMLAWLQYQAPPQAKQNIPKTHPISNYSPWLKIKLLAKTYNATTQFITEVMDTRLSSVTIIEPDSFNFSFFSIRNSPNVWEKQRHQKEKMTG